jgi:hypothetical protein
MRTLSDNWPRTLTAKLAADYLGCRSPAQFRREVAAGIWPKPLLTKSRPQRWSIEELESALRPAGRTGERSPALDRLERKLGIADEKANSPPRVERQQGRRP